MFLTDPLNAVQRRLQSFYNRHGELHLLFLCHAALPMALTTDLLYCIWANFQFDSHGKALHIPWLAVPDVVLSGLLQEVGYELYELPQSVRTELVDHLKEHPRLGSKRIQELASFLLAYISQQPKPTDLDDHDLAQAQRWGALAYVQPGQVARELAIALSQANRQNELELVRIASLIQTLKTPLEEADFESLLVYAWGMKELAQQGKLNQFNGLIQLSQDPDYLRNQFTNILQGKRSSKIVTSATKINFKTYTQAALLLMKTAKQEARRLKYSFITPEHILLGIVQTDTPAASAVLSYSGVTLQRLRQSIATMLGTTGSGPRSATMALTSWKNLLSFCSRRVLAFAQAEAEKFNHSEVNVEHLMLGILQEGDNLACVVLEGLGISLQDLYSTVLQSLASDIYGSIFISTDDVTFEDCNELATKVLKSAETEAIILRHNFISTGHMLLSLLREEGISSIIMTLGLEQNDSKDTLHQNARSELEKIGYLPASELTTQIRFTPWVKKVLTLAREEARSREHTHVSTALLLLGLLQESENTACSLLNSLGIDPLRLWERVNWAIESSSKNNKSGSNIEAGLFARFSNSAIEAVVFAQEEALRLKHNGVDGEHILCGLIKQKKNAAAYALESCGVTLPIICTEIERTIGYGNQYVGPEIPFTITGKIILGSAIDEAHKMGDGYIAPEHLLLSLLRLKTGIAHQALNNLGVQASVVRTRVLEILVQTAIPPTFVIPPTLEDMLNDQALYILKLAQEEACRLQYNFVGSETLLFGLIRAGSSLAAQTLIVQGVTCDAVRNEIEIALADCKVFAKTDFLLTPGIKRVIIDAFQIARQNSANYVNPDYLLLSLLQHSELLSFKILETLGVNIARTQVQILEGMGLDNFDFPTTSSTPTEGETESFSFDCLTPKSLIAIQLAIEESRRLNLDSISLEQFFFGLVSEGMDIAAKVLRSQGVTNEELRLRCQPLTVRYGLGKVSFWDVELNGETLHFDLSVKRSLSLALKEAQQLNDSQVNTGHLLLGCLHLLNSGTTLAGILQSYGVDLAQLRAMTLQALANGKDSSNVL